MALYGYARVSSLEQDLTLQEEMLRAAGCQIVRAEKKSGTAREGRSELRLLLGFLHRGDTLVVTRIDRLARSVKDLQDIVHELKAKGVALRATEQPVDTGSAAGKAFLDMLGVFAEFETNLRRERQMEGIRAAKAKGVYKGCKPRIDAAEVRRLREGEGLGPAVIARRLGIGRASVYRLLGKGGQTTPAPRDDAGRNDPAAPEELSEPVGGRQRGPDRRIKSHR
jgi:DNA invertase Pin-like site-specific DNA recombinase